MKKILISCVFLVLLVYIGYATGQKEQGETSKSVNEIITLKWYQPEPVGHPWTDVGEMICNEIEKQSKGKIKIVQYPAGTLGTQAQAVEMLRMGSLGILTSGPSILNSFDEDVQVFSAPYLFRDREHAYKAFNMPWVQDLFNNRVLKKSGVRTIAFWYFGERHLTTKSKMIVRPSDLKGRAYPKFCVNGNSYSDTLSP